MREFSELTLWEISHYWHGYSPDQTSPSKLPLEVEKTLRVLAGGASKGLYFRCTKDSTYYQVFSEQAWTIRSIAKIYQRELKRAYQGRRFKKKFLDSLTMTRTAIAKWCKKTNTPAPSFWFDEDDPLLKKSIDQLDTFSALTRNNLFYAFPLFPKQNDVNSINSNSHTDATVNPESLNSLMIPSNEKQIKQAISRLAQSNALMKYKTQHEIKKNFIRYFHANKLENRNAAAKAFFATLTTKEKLRLVPTYDESEPEQSLDKAVRTLTTGLREFFSDNPPEWLKGFDL